MPTVRETVAEMVQYVFPQYAGAPGQIYGTKLRGAGGPLPPLVATSGVEQRQREAADPRHAARVARVRALKEGLALEPAW